MIPKFIKAGVITLLLALTLGLATVEPVLAQSTGKGAPVPFLVSLITALGGSDSTVTGDAPLGTNPKQQADVFTRADDPGDLGFMKTMWGFTRQLTNVMVVVFLFIAAAATTLNFQVSTYGIKKTLPSVLLATLYANFSYAIAKLFDQVNLAVFGAFTGTGASDQAGNALKLMSHFMQGPLYDRWQLVGTTGNDALKNNILAILALAVMAVLALGLLLLVLLFIVRNYFLAMLIAIAPLAFMSLAMPFTQAAFKKWWDQFIRWMFFPAIAGFWLYMGGVALTAAGISGGLIGIVMAALILWVAIRTPFTIGAGVAAAAGFITGYATRGLGMAGRAAGKTGKFAANTTLGGTWDQIRLRTAAGYEQTLLGRAARGRRQARTRLEKNVELERGRAAWTPTQMRDKRNPFLRLNNMFQNYMATNVGHMEADLAVKEGRNKRETATGQRNASKTGAGQRRATLTANDKIETDVAETQFKQAQLAAEVEARRNNPLSLALGHAQEAVAGLEDSIAGITALYKKQALEEGESLRQLRRIGMARKALGEQSYQREMGLIKKEAREGSDEIATAIGDELVQAMGEGIAEGGFNQAKLRRAMVELSGSSQDIEETMKSISERDLTNYQARKMMAEDALASYPIMAKGHDMNQTQFGDYLTAEEAITIDPTGEMSYQDNEQGKQLKMAAQKMGIGHLSVAEQVDAIREHTSNNNKEFRSAARINAQKTMGKSRASRISLTAEELSDESAHGLVRDETKDIIAGLKAMENPGASNINNIGNHLDNEDSDVESMKTKGAVDSMHGLVRRFKAKSGQQAIFSEYSSMMATLAPILQARGYNPSDMNKVRMVIPGSKGVTIGRAIAHLGTGGEFKDSTGTRVITNVPELIRDAVVEELTPHLRLKDDSSTGIVAPK